MITIQLFGITKDIIGASVLQVDMDGNSVFELRSHLSKSYPKLDKLNSLMVAVNSEYAADSLILKTEDEVVLIPPVSGG